MTGSLGFASEYWDGVAQHYEGSQELQMKLLSLGRDDSNSEVVQLLSMGLLDDVVVAAGGVEDAATRLREVKSQLRTWVTDNDILPLADRDFGISCDGTVEAWFSLVNALVWGRTFYERLDRRPSPRAPKGLRNQGLIPAIAIPELKRKAEELLCELRKGPLGEMRTVTNFTLHAAMPQNPWSGARMTPSGQILLPFPDEVTNWVGHWHLFEWEDRRDGFAIVEVMWRSVQLFMDDLLDAFEEHAPKRLRIGGAGPIAKQMRSECPTERVMRARSRTGASTVRGRSPASEARGAAEVTNSRVAPTDDGDEAIAAVLEGECISGHTLGRAGEAIPSSPTSL